MKEITRRLYTKPVMLGMAFLVGMALVIALSVTGKSTAAPNSFPVGAGNDEFETAADGETYHDFGGSKIPANFFGAGSLPYGELVALEGVPLAPGSNVDTIIERHRAVSQPGDSTPLTMTALSLKSTDPIIVTFSNGTTSWTESWDMTVDLSRFKSSTGTMTINFNTFDSTLKVWPRFTFTRNGVTKVLDTGASGGPGLTAAAEAPIDGTFEPAPAPAPAPCKVIAKEFEVQAKTSVSAAAASSCPPVTLTSTNSPWGPCTPGTFCITVPITEEERWARHRPRPKGSIQIGIAE
jgi:hypothetical protein